MSLDFALSLWSGKEMTLLRGKRECFCCAFAPFREKEILDFITYGLIIRVSTVLKERISVPSRPGPP